MGGRGASSGMSSRGYRYGEEYRTVLAYRNIKFIEKRHHDSSMPMETQADGRIYVHVDGEKLKSVIFFDEEHKRSKQIDLDHSHRGMKPHVHHGYYHNEHDPKDVGATPLNREERQLVDKVVSIWENKRAA